MKGGLMAKFIYANSNPKVDTNDCAVRSIATASGKPWVDVMRGLCDIAIDECRMPNDIVVVHRYLRENFNTDIINVIGRGMSLDDFCKEYPVGKYAVQCMTHGVAVIDGVIYDTYDSSNDEVATAARVG